jgi:predicted nicotinamide N-methyase
LPDACTRFVREHTTLQRPPHVPEIQLHLAHELEPVWRSTEEELAEKGLPPPFWAFAWAGGQGLARYLLDHPYEAKGRRVVDFATGSGLVAIAAAKAGAVSVLASDLDAYAGAAVALNAQANGVQVAFTGENLLLAPPPAADLITAGDICYERPVAEQVMEWLGRAHRAGARVLIGDPNRSYFPRDRLVQLAEYRVETTREIEDMAVKQTGVWTFPG